MAIKTPIGFEDQPSNEAAPPPTYSAATSAPSAPNANANANTDLERGDNHQPFSALNGAQPKPLAGTSPHPQWGPTPLIPGAGLPPQTAGLWAQGLPMPVYDPNSQYSRQMAGRRARRRFFEALFWGVVIWMALGLLFGGIEVDIQRWTRRRHRPS